MLKTDIEKELTVFKSYYVENMKKDTVLTHSPIHSLIHALSYSLTHSPIHTLTHSRTHSPRGQLKMPTNADDLNDLAQYKLM